MRLGVTSVICVLAGGLVATPGGPVQAQGLFELLFNPAQRYERRAPRDPYWYSPPVERPLPQVHVKSPAYYTYQPDVLKTYSLASLAQVETASADPEAMPPAATPFTAALAQLSSSVKIRTFREVASAIKAHYAEHPQFIWVTDDRVNDKAHAAIAALGRADRFGLEPRDYRVEVPQDTVDSADEAARQERLIRFEMELSAKVLTYVLDATRGRVDPNRISGYHDLPRKEVDLGKALRTMAEIDNVAAYLEARNPSNPQFRALVKELAKLRAEDGGDRVSIAPGTFIRPGATSPEVANIVAAIRQRGSEALKAKHADTLAIYNGGEKYTPELVALVRDFQGENHLWVDGIIGKRTIDAMTVESQQQKIDKVELAMERARWLPGYLGERYVFINEPAFEATYAQVGKKPLTMRIIVGKKSNQTYFFADKVEKVEYNPYWGVPESIIINEMMPHIYRDPGYLDRLGYEVTTQKGRRVSSRNVDWYGVATRQVPINVRQPPGPKNALGAVKILFPNAHSIYMHDTPAKELFKADARAFSHGCVRLQEPREMAAAVLGKSVDYVNRRIAGGQNDSDPVTANIAVYVSYFTAWPTPDGAVHYYNDMYERDMYLTRAIDRTESTRHPNG